MNFGGDKLMSWWISKFCSTWLGRQCCGLHYSLVCPWQLFIRSLLDKLELYNGFRLRNLYCHLWICFTESLTYRRLSEIFLGLYKLDLEILSFLTLTMRCAKNNKTPADSFCNSCDVIFHLHFRYFYMIPLNHLRPWVFKVWLLFALKNERSSSLSGFVVEFIHAKKVPGKWATMGVKMALKLFLLQYTWPASISFTWIAIQHFFLAFLNSGDSVLSLDV